MSNGYKQLKLIGKFTGKHFFDDLIEFIVSGPVIALELMGDDVIARWNKIIGPNNASEARRFADFI